VVTNASGTVEQTLDYFPYGGTRISIGQNPTSRQYIGQFADQSNLDYLQARYMNPTQGQFISQDPVFLAVGDPTQIQQLIQQDQQKLLSDPQQMNSYSYARNNPIVNKDPNGHGLIGELGEIGLRMIEARNAPYTVFGSYYSTYGNPNVPVSQRIGAAIDVGIPAVLLLTPSLSPVAGVVGIWEAFVFSGEVITGRDPSESAEYVEGLISNSATRCPNGTTRKSDAALSARRRQPLLSGARLPPREPDRGSGPVSGAKASAASSRGAQDRTLGPCYSPSIGFPRMGGPHEHLPSTA
jgi:RHS repeat-associated protein